MERIVITGASSGIGFEIAALLARPGRRIWLIGRDEERLAAIAEKVRAGGAEAVARRVDVSDPEESRSFLETEFPEGAPPDQVYLSSGVSMFGEVKDVYGRDWDWIYRNNLAGPFQWLLHVYKGMVAARRGRIVVISSLSAYTGYPTAIPYATMKAGLLGLHRSLRHEAVAHGVSLHLVSPGYVDTRIFERAKYRATSYDETMRLIGGLGFRMIPAADAAAHIVRGVEKGRGEFCVPAYACLMSLIAPRFPWLIHRIHRKVLNEFRRPGK